MSLIKLSVNMTLRKLICVNRILPVKSTECGSNQICYSYIGIRILLCHKFICFSELDILQKSIYCRNHRKYKMKRNWTEIKMKTKEGEGNSTYGDWLNRMKIWHSACREL